MDIIFSLHYLLKYDDNQRYCHNPNKNKVDHRQDFSLRRAYVKHNEKLIRLQRNEE